MTDGLGLGAFIHIVVNLLCLVIAWWALESFRFDLFVKNPKSKQAALLRVMCAIALGTLVARFLLDYFQATQLLPYLF
ncbi:DUF1146 family protein [Shouchella clausii]|uniref:DUF1146 domain-containing protein n=2 Tax=Shouchella clausii TaxID=79880 RepID=Q5WB80_SHOC1|nr:DUF1146 family protein [Shouchella clausii]PAD44181.1 DUF1146 domain-containing protein [Bacillus sp. 7520-S]SHL29384.1 conserved hypothetical integral membrane protein [Shouchella rhizosphaerae]BAD66380.1 conserved hypothetical protein [Shouchella clausii KSM-K16]AST95898.1 hypothetical protein BC8716_08020 [Shouchella clausii]KKI85905.1 membrane protein [Shouchella clausii]